MSDGETYKHKFDKAGRYKYHCDYHPRMKATVVVED
jgi:plastocyanin